MSNTVRADNTCTVAYFGSVLQHDIELLLKRLKADEILQPSGIPYAEHVNRGYFLAAEGDERDASVRLTGKGQIWLARRYPHGTSLEVH